jgi:hypothetical protein
MDEISLDLPMDQSFNHQKVTLNILHGDKMIALSNLGSSILSKETQASAVYSNSASGV